MENVLRTYKYYSKSGRRLSIFAEEVEGKLKITVFKCDKGDTFSKRVGRGLYKFWKEVGRNPITKPDVYIAPLGEKTAKFVFNQWCLLNFRKKPKKYFDMNAEIPTPVIKNRKTRINAES